VPNIRLTVSLRQNPRAAATGKFVAVLGHYNPHTKELVIKREEVQKYLGNGAQPSNTVVKLLTHEKIDLPKWVKLKTKQDKKAAQAAEAATAEATKKAAPKAEGEEAPALENADEAPALQKSDERVAEVNEAEASTAEDNAPNINETDTAASEEAAAGQAQASEDAAADAAVKSK
jgi:ribosomal protein S16